MEVIKNITLTSWHPDKPAIVSCDNNRSVEMIALKVVASGHLINLKISGCETGYLLLFFAWINIFMMDVFLA